MVSPQVLRTPENDPAMLLGSWLRDGRVAAGFPTQEALADELGFDRTVITKGETGDRPPTDAVLKKACKACNLDYEKFSGLAKVARAARGESPVRAWFADYIDAEGKAHTIRIWQPLIFPGLFQVPEYAMPLFLAMGKGEEWAREQLEVRIGRQAILDRPEPPSIIAVLDQSILYRRIGSPQVMRKQIEHVVELSHRPNMMIHILPSDVGANAGLGGAIHLAAGHGMPEVLLTGALVEDQITSDPALVVQASDTFNLVRSDALHRAASRTVMTEAIGNGTASASPLAQVQL